MRTGVRSMSKITKKRTRTSRVSRDNFVTKWTDYHFVVDKSIIRNQYYIYVCILYYFLSCQYLYWIDVNTSTLQNYIRKRYVQYSTNLNMFLLYHRANMVQFYRYTLFGMLLMSHWSNELPTYANDYLSHQLDSYPSPFPV